MINGYIIAAAVFFISVTTSYIYNFKINLGYTTSNDTAVWGQLGDYVGGLLNPVFSFISLVLLIKSLGMQNEANKRLRDELKNSEKTEKTRSFEALFFNMINSQKELFDSLIIEFNREGKKLAKVGVEAVMEIEDNIEKIKERVNSDEEIRIFLEDVDSKEQIFGVTRVFYVMVRMISEKLSDSQGFDSADRRSHLLTLINFTNFSQLRLIMISLQFMNYHSVEYLRKDEEFCDALEDVGLSYNLY